MTIEKNKVVVLTYELEVDGAIADRATKERPLDYIHGNNMLLPKFEQELEGKTEGDTFAFTLTPSEGYGEYEPERKFDIPKESFQIDGQIREDLLEVGRIIPMLNSAGQVVQGTIADVKDSTVTMDFNHPMAGKTLNFKGEILSIREATEKELAQGLHGEFLPEECGCGCGCEGEGHGHCHCHEDGDDCHCHEEGHECHHHEGGCGCNS